MARRERGSIVRFFGALLVTSMVLVLAGAVVYLLSDINQRNFRLSARNGQLLVERGKFFPTGFQPYTPDTPPLRDAYAPIPLPQNATLSSSEVFSDRADVDRALFALLAGWTRTLLDDRAPTALEQAGRYAERLALLPGLSEEQRTELRSLRGDLAYRQGRRILTDMTRQLETALTQLRLAQSLGTSRHADVGTWVAEVERRLAALRAMDSQPAESSQQTDSSAATGNSLATPGAEKNRQSPPSP